MQIKWSSNRVGCKVLIIYARLLFHLICTSDHLGLMWALLFAAGRHDPVCDLHKKKVEACCKVEVQFRTTIYDMSNKCDGILNVQATSVGPIHKKSPNLPDITPLLTCSQVSMQHLWLSVKALRHMGQLLLHGIESPRWFGGFLNHQQ